MTVDRSCQKFSKTKTNQLNKIFFIVVILTSFVTLYQFKKDFKVPMEYIPKGTRDFSVKLMDACIELAHHRQALRAQRVMYKRHIIYIKMKNSFFVSDKNSKPKY